MKPEETTEEMKYFERLNISVLAIDKIKELIKSNIKNTFKCWEKGKNIEKQTFHIVGPAGVGKTQICQQLSEELTQELGKPFGNILIKCPVLSRDDLLIPFPVTDNGNTKFKMLYSDFVPIDKDSYGIFVIDELGRGDHNLQQLCWQIQNEYKIHLMDLPQGWFVVCLDNPDDQEYSMDTLVDAAGLRRCLHIYSDVSVQAFLNYAIKKEYHPLIIEYIQIHPDYLYDFPAQKMGSVYANPASWERVSNILWGYDYSEGGVMGNLLDIDYEISGLINVNQSRMFIEYIRDKKDISPKDIFNNYSKVEKDIKKYVKDGENAKLGKIMASFVNYITTSRPEFTEKELKNVALFLTHIPSDISATFITKIDTFSRQSEEFKYATKLHVSLTSQSEEYRTKFYDEMVSVGKIASL